MTKRVARCTWNRLGLTREKCKPPVLKEQHTFGVSRIGTSSPSLRNSFFYPGKQNIGSEIVRSQCFVSWPAEMLTVNWAFNLSLLFRRISQNRDHRKGAVQFTLSRLNGIRWRWTPKLSDRIGRQVSKHGRNNWCIIFIFSRSSWWCIICKHIQIHLLWPPPPHTHPSLNLLNKGFINSNKS